MNKAFIFDMDGVLVDSERAWAQFEKPFFERIFGKDITEKIGNTTGIGIDRLYEKAVSLGATVEMDAYRQGFDEVAMRVYDVAPITNGVERLAHDLLTKGFKLGLVTQSRQNWTDRVVPRLSFKDELEAIVSVASRHDIKPKPFPDAFLEVFRTLDAAPERSIILEDSNYGIEAGKATGAYVIGFSGNLTVGYKQDGADAYADTMEEVQKLVEGLTQR